MTGSRALSVFVPMRDGEKRPASRAVEAAPRSLSASTVKAESGGERETCKTPRPVPYSWALSNARSANRQNNGRIRSVTC